MSDRRRRQIVRVLEEDRGLGEDLDRATLARAERLSQARVVMVGVGAWQPLDAAAEELWLLGLLVLDGWIVRRVNLGGRRGADLLGPGDVIRPFEGVADDLSMVPAHVSWEVLEPVRLAVLDGRFQGLMLGYPEVLSAVLDRLSRRYGALALRVAMGQERLDATLHLLMWQLADRFGRVEAEGVLLPMPAGHELLAELVSATRPAASRELKKLEQAGLVSPAGKKRWRLHGRPPRDAAQAGVAGSLSDV